MKKIGVEDLKNKLAPGYLYLTLGTVSQVQRLTNLLLKPTSVLFLYHPTRFELQQSIQYTVEFTDQPVVHIIFPKLDELRPVGLKKVKGKEIKPYDFPFSLFIPSNSYVFVCLCEVSGEITDKAKNVASKLQSSTCKYEILDLRHIHDLSAFPPPPLPSESSPSPLITPEQQLLFNLKSYSGVIQWGSFTDSEILKWFITPNQPEPLLFIKANARALVPYAAPFCKLLEKYWGSEGKGEILKSFARWVFLASTVWNESSYNGLRIKSKKMSNTVNYSFFLNPSSTARQKLLDLLESINRFQ